MRLAVDFRDLAGRRARPAAGARAELDSRRRVYLKRALRLAGVDVPPETSTTVLTRLLLAVRAGERHS